MILGPFTQPLSDERVEELRAEWEAGYRGRPLVVLADHLLITPMRASRWMVVYATAIELLRHGRPAAFLAGVVLTLLALSALPSTVRSSPDLLVEGSAVRAGRMVEARISGTERPTYIEPSSSDPARTNTAIDELPASAPSASPRTMVAPLRDDPALVLAARASPVPRSLVVAIAVEHGLDGDHFADVMFCESSFRPDAIGDGGRAVGIAQFHAPTWASSSRRYYGMELAPATRLDAELALLVAARKWAAEGPWAWTCARGY